MHQSVLTGYRILKCIERSWRLMMHNILTQWYLHLIWKLWISALQSPLPLWKNTASVQDANEEKKKNHMTSFSAAINTDVMHKLLFQVGLSLVCQCQTYFTTERLIKSSVWSSGILHDSHLFLRSTQDSRRLKVYIRRHQLLNKDKLYFQAISKKCLIDSFFSVCHSTSSTTFIYLLLGMLSGGRVLLGKRPAWQRVRRQSETAWWAEDRFPDRSHQLLLLEQFPRSGVESSRASFY